MKKFIKDFKEFAFKGNILDMAVGVIIGSAFGKIVTSLVSDIITPLISLLTGAVSLTDLVFVLKPEELNEAGEVIQAQIALSYGSFIQNIIDFFLIAISIFVVLRIIMNAEKKLKSIRKKEEEAEKQEEAAQADTELSVLLEIRELLKKENAEETE